MNLILIPLALLLAPILLSVINKTKSWSAGRRGPRWFQPYWDLSKLLQKGVVYSRTTSFIFRLNPYVSLAAVLTTLLFIPLNGWGAALSFEGDMVALAAFLALARFLTLLGALDTGSSFEGMGASREVFFGALTEPIFFLILLALSRLTGTLSLSPALFRLSGEAWAQNGSTLLLLGASLFILLLVENARIPVDDPQTHLELTMIHEVMILDYSGPDLGFLEYAASLKIWVFSAVLTGLLCPWKDLSAGMNLLFFLGGMALVAVTVGVVESIVARLKMTRVSLFIASSFVLVLLALTRLVGVLL